MNKRPFHACCRAALLCLGVAIAIPALFLTSAGAQAAPLLQEGKKTLFQRVVTHPGAQLFAEPGKKSLRTLTPFTVLYVYARSKGWVQIGSGTQQPDGWIEAARCTPWNQSLTLLFSPRTGRDPVLFFKSENGLNDVCQAPDMEERLDSLLAAAQSGNPAADLPIVASEPAETRGAVSEKRFYLMPILQMKDPYEGVKFLQVASIDPGNAAHQPTVTGSPRTGIAIVMDTSVSMKPYIDQSRDVVSAIYDQLERDGMTDNVGFAVVAFRSSPKATPKLGYTTRVISDFATAKNRSALEQRLAEAREAAVSSHDFNEDSLAGVYKAIESLRWDDYSSRLILLVTDAGPLRANDKYRSTPMAAREMNDFARQKGIWISTLHIKSPKGSGNHAYAEQNYRALSRLSGDRANYQAVNASTPARGAKEFSAVAAILARGMVEMVKNTAEGKIMTRPKEKTPVNPTPEEQAQRLAADLGYAMQLEYLGRRNANRAPDVVSSWIADMDLKKLARGEHEPSVDVAVLLTKNQLNDLSVQLRSIIDNAERTKKTDARDFFQGILSASTRMARDPNAPTQGKSLAELDVLGEFLDGLPYRSDIMLLREDDWYRMSIGEQTAFINRLKSRLARYEEYDRDRDNWESFGQANAGDWVYRVPLTMLP